MKLVQSVVKERCPELGTIPKILMTKEDEVSGLRHFPQQRQLSGIQGQEIGLELWVLTGCPASSRFVELGCSDVDACEFCFARRVGEQFSEEPCLIRATTG